MFPLWYIRHHFDAHPINRSGLPPNSRERSFASRAIKLATVAGSVASRVASYVASRVASYVAARVASYVAARVAASVAAYVAAVAVKNKFSVGDSLELMTPQGNVNFTLEHMENGKGETMPVAPGDGYTVWLPVPDDLPLQYALLMRNFTGQTTRNPHGN